MADAVIDIVGPEDLPDIVALYNKIFRPTRDVESIRRRYLGRYNGLQLVARLQDRPVGFFLGFELKPTVFFAWFYGVLPEFRRMGIGRALLASALDRAAHAVLSVAESNQAARALYRSLGFTLAVRRLVFEQRHG